MSELYVMVTITNRKLTKKFSAFYQENGVDVSVITVGNGTAASEILDYFGLDGSEKSVLFQVVTGEKWKELKYGLQRKMQIDVPGIGIAFVVPISSMGGKKALNYLTDGQNFIKGEESSLKDTKYELLVVIANQGYTDLIMDAAREVHATGGTVIHAKGTGAALAKKFYGITLTEEKEMIFIVVRTEQKNAIMKAIMENAGTKTPAGGICFSLPVTSTAGLRLIPKEE